MQRIDLLIGKVLLIGVMLSLLLVITGGVLYLYGHSSDLINYQQFHQEPKNFASISSILRSGYIFTPFGLIHLGISVLIFVQFLRVILTGWLFERQKDFVFVAISLFVLAIMCYSVL